MYNSVKSAAIFWALLWAVLVAAALIFRPLMPVDETRYVSVAWEMWLRGDFLVPHLNSATYSHKPPLLFWLMQAGWSVVGVNEWSARVVGPLFGLGCLFLTALAGWRLWPGRQVHVIAPLFMLGTIFWGLYTTLTMFDLILTFWALVGIHGLIDVKQGRIVRGWILFAIGLGLGVMTKGPVILFFLVPLALLAPVWADRRSGARWIGWYAGAIVGVALGAGIALSWALPAGFAGGETYRNEIFWGQSAGRVVNSFDHAQPGWWYLPLLPVMLLPWILWPALWRGMADWWREARGDRNIWFTAIWFGAALILLSMVSGKRPHYLLPAFPALALMGGVFLDRILSRGDSGNRWEVLPWAIFAWAIGGLVAAAPIISGLIADPDSDAHAWLSLMSPLWAIAPVVAGILLLFAGRSPQLLTRMTALCLVTIVLLVTIHGAAGPRLREAYDLHAISKYLAKVQADGYAIANWGKYHGQYNFLGRLKPNIATIGSGEIGSWLEQNPKGKIVTYHYKMREDVRPEFSTPFRGRFIAVWDNAQIKADPTLTRR